MAWLIALFFFVFFGFGTGSASVSAPQPAMHLLFTVDGKPVDAHGQPTLRPGQVLRFEPPVRAFTLVRLECRNVVRRIALPPQRTWRVPDLAGGMYTIRGRGPSFTFNYVVRVRNHSAACPG